jgi:CBS-domain-containing membrane protein
MPQRFIHRFALRTPASRWFKTGAAAFTAFAIAALIGDATGATMMLAPMAASAALIFGLPESPLSQPAQVIGGHMVAAFIGLLAITYLPHNHWVLAFTVACSIAALGLLRLTHPPAAATTMVILMTHPTWMFLLTPVLSGAVTLVVVAFIAHKLPPRSPYPLPVPPKQ